MMLVSTFDDEEYYEDEQQWREEIERIVPDQSSVELRRHEYTINDIPIAFPYEAYESQHQMMDRMTYALKRSENCLLESPTGTGKTAALLCGLLGWQKVAEEKGNEGNGWPWEIDEATLAAGCTCGFIPKQDAAGNDFKILQQTVKERYRDFVILKRYGYELVEREIPFENDGPSTSNIEVSSPKKKRKVLVPQLKTVPEESRGQSDLCRFCIRTYYKESSVPIIYYATRTLSQVKQVANELKATFYSRGIEMTILASRNNTCLNLDVLKSADINEECQKLRKNYWRSIKSQGDGNGIANTYESNRICGRYGTHNASIYGNFPPCEAEGVPGAWDIEDLNKYSSRHSGCSYYGSKILKETAKIVFCTYNHLLQANIREFMKIDLTNSVIVFDEAHNIEDLCREKSSVKITQTHIDRNIIPELERSLSPENSAEIPPGISPILNELLNFFKKLTNWFDTRSKLIEFNYEIVKEHHKEFSDDELARQMTEVGFTKENMIKYTDDLYTLSEVAKGKEEEEPNDDNNTENSNERVAPSTNNFKFSTTVITYMSNIFYKFYYIFGEGKNASLQEHYKAAFTKKVISSAPNIRGMREYKFENEFHNICLNPALTFEPLKRRAHSIIVASGTLSPLHSFESELDTPFPVTLSAPHVIPKTNVFSSVITSGPNGEELCFNYHGQGVDKKQLELGMCILNICKRVPKGVLVFLPSYRWMDKLRNKWTNSPLLSQIRAIKKVFFEKKDMQLFQQDMKEYTETIAAGTIGCVLFAVFRGKVSEGVDFKDDQARAVVTVGIPYTSKNDPFVGFKMTYNDKVNARNTTGKRVLSSGDWYATQAFRALNQAFGRCLRHKNDWGSLIILEERMEKYCNKSKLSKWVAVDLKTYQNFNNLEIELEEFVQRKQNENLSNEDNNLLAEQDVEGIALVSTPNVPGEPTLSDGDGVPQIAIENVEIGIADAPTQVILNDENLRSGNNSNTTEFDSPQVAQLFRDSVQLNSPTRAPRRQLQF